MNKTKPRIEKKMEKNVKLIACKSILCMYIFVYVEYFPFAL